jgi:shikimate dehydrogenase
MRKRLALIGGAISHSLSPRIQNELFEWYRLPYRYELIATTEEELPEVVARIRSGEISGANVTSPFKVSIVSLLDRLSERAMRVGGVNTIAVEDGALVGHNTDVTGFAGTLDGIALFDRSFSVNILGRGAAAMAAVVALLRFATLDRLTIYSRDSTHAATLLQRFDDPRLSVNRLDDYRAADLVVHATPVGLNDSSQALLRVDQFVGTSLLYEMIYSPAETLLMQRAREAGCSTLGGLPMLVRQALASFQLWTGIEPGADGLSGDLRALLKPGGGITL